MGKCAEQDLKVEGRDLAFRASFQVVEAFNEIDAGEQPHIHEFPEEAHDILPDYRTGFLRDGLKLVQDGLDDEVRKTGRCLLD